MSLLVYFLGLATETSCTKAIVCARRTQSLLCNWFRLFELNHAANVFACHHVGVGVVDLVEGIGARHQLVQLKLARAVHLEQVGDVVARLRVAVERPHQRLLEEDEVERRYRNRLGGGRGEADDDDGAVLAGGGVCLPDGRGRGDGLEGVVDALAPCQLARLLYRVLACGVDGMRRAQFFRLLQLEIVDVDGDNHARPGDSRALDGVGANAAAADDHNRATRLDLRAMDDRAHARWHAAADENRAVERVVVGNGNDRQFGNDGALREGRDDAHLADIGAVLVHAEGAVKLRPGQDSRALVAQVGVARCAVAALTAAWNKAQHYMIAGFDAGDL